MPARARGRSSGRLITTWAATATRTAMTAVELTPLGMKQRAHTAHCGWCWPDALVPVARIGATPIPNVQ
eukprot:15444772-Alexandrium_andersonii.AAC.1